MAYKPMFPKAKGKQRSGFKQYKNVEEFEKALSRCIKEDMDVLIELGRR